MADPIVDNGSLTDFRVAGKQLSGADSPLVEAVELVTATEGGAKVDLAKAEDAAHASGDYGLMALGVRKDTATVLSGADGDYTPFIVDASGRMWASVGYMPAADYTTDNLGAAPLTNVVMNGRTALTPKWATITASASGSTTVIAAVASKKIRITSLVLTANAAVNAKFLNAAGADLTGLFYFAANGGMVLPDNPRGWFPDGATNTAFAISLSGAVAVGGVCSYLEI